MKQKNNNLLDYIPVIAKDVLWKESHFQTNYQNSIAGDLRYARNIKRNSVIILRRENKGFYNRIAQHLFHRPKTSFIELDEYGSFLWKNYHQQRTVYELGQILKEQFGAEAEPIYDRLIMYLLILRNNRFIILQKKDKIENSKKRK